MDDRHAGRMTAFAAILALAFFLAIGFWSGERPARQEHATDSFRRHHLKFKQELGPWTELLEALPGADPERQVQIMDFAVQFLKERIRPHAREEEKLLYPAVDRHAGAGPNPFTACLRQEHRIIDRRIDELDERALAKVPDVAAFLRAGHQLAGLLRAHFEVEEEVLLPILDRAMTPEQFRREIGSRMGMD